jgi:hypothetical protein
MSGVPLTRSPPSEVEVGEELTAIPLKVVLVATTRISMFKNYWYGIDT